MFYPLLSKRISSVTGSVANIKLPSIIRPFALNSFINKFGINREEIEKDILDYNSLNALFTRQLKPQARPISDAQIVSPVDARIQEFGKIRVNQLIQAKQVYYTLEDLIPGPESQNFIDGTFITMYLAPHDCHLMFSPCHASIYQSMYVPGTLYPVREPHISKTKGLYTRNERIISFLTSEIGKVAYIKVGAINVGSISLSYDDDIKAPNNKIYSPITKNYAPNIPIKKGEQIATFHLGSTVILCFEKGVDLLSSLKREQKVLIGAPLV